MILYYMNMRYNDILYYIILYYLLIARNVGSQVVLDVWRAAGGLLWAHAW